MNYKDLIDRLRDHADDREAIFGPGLLREAADVIESLTAQLAAGPVVWQRWNASVSFPNVYYLGAFDHGHNPLPEGWRETPLYAIPIPEVKE